MNDKPTTNDKEASCPPPESGYDVIPPLKFNPDKYREGLEAFDLTKEQEDQFLEAMWTILSRFVDLGFGEDSVQMFFATLDDKAGQDSGKTLEPKDRAKIPNGTVTTNARKDENHA